MKNQYQVVVQELKEVHELPGAWNSDNLKMLLEHLDYEDIESIPDEELKDMAAMALSDLEPVEAAIALLDLFMSERLNKGQKATVAEDLRGERLWEEYAQIQDHEALFNMACMLHWAFPKQYSEPDIVRIRLEVVAMNKPSAQNLQQPTAAFMARLLNDGMDEHNIIYRLFDDQIAGNLFAEAEHIIWTMEHRGFDPEANSNNIIVHTSWNWVDELKGVKAYESNAHADGQLK